MWSAPIFCIGYVNMFINAVLLVANATGWYVQVRSNSSASIQTICRGNWTACVLLTMENNTLNVKGKIAKECDVHFVSQRIYTLTKIFDVSVCLYEYLHYYFSHMQVTSAPSETIYGLVPVEDIINLSALHVQRSLDLSAYKVTPITLDFYTLELFEGASNVALAFHFTSFHVILHNGNNTISYVTGSEFADGMFCRQFKISDLFEWTYSELTCIVRSWIHRQAETEPVFLD